MKHFTHSLAALCALLLCAATARAYELPTPTTKISELNIIDRQTVDFEFDSKGQGGGWMQFNVKPLLDKAGVTMDDVKPVANQLV